jgi:hypothetical protein
MMQVALPATSAGEVAIMRVRASDCLQVKGRPRSLVSVSLANAEPLRGEVDVHGDASAPLSRDMVTFRMPRDAYVSDKVPGSCHAYVFGFDGVPARAVFRDDKLRGAGHEVKTKPFVMVTLVCDSQSASTALASDVKVSRAAFRVPAADMARHVGSVATCSCVRAMKIGDERRARRLADVRAVAELPLSGEMEPKVVGDDRLRVWVEWPNAKTAGRNPCSVVVPSRFVDVHGHRLHMGQTTRLALVRDVDECRRRCGHAVESFSQQGCAGELEARLAEIEDRRVKSGIVDVVCLPLSGVHMPEAVGDRARVWMEWPNSRSFGHNPLVATVDADAVSEDGKSLTVPADRWLRFDLDVDLKARRAKVGVNEVKPFSREGTASKLLAALEQSCREHVARGHTLDDVPGTAEWAYESRVVERQANARPLQPFAPEVERTSDFRRGTRIASVDSSCVKMIDGPFGNDGAKVAMTLLNSGSTGVISYAYNEADGVPVILQAGPDWVRSDAMGNGMSVWVPEGVNTLSFSGDVSRGGSPTMSLTLPVDDVCSRIVQNSRTKPVVNVPRVREQGVVCVP